MDFCPCYYSLKKSNMSRAIFQILSQNTKLRVKVAYTGWQNCAPFGSNYLYSIGLTRHLDCRFWVKILNPFFHLVCTLHTGLLVIILPHEWRFLGQRSRNSTIISWKYYWFGILPLLLFFPVSKNTWDFHKNVEFSPG